MAIKSPKKPWIPKENPNIPDFYEITLISYDKSEEKLQIVSHRFDQALGIIEMRTHDDLVKIRRLEGIYGFDFDIRLSKMLELKRQNDLKEGKK